MNVEDSRPVIISLNYPLSDDNEQNFKNSKIFELSKSEANLPDEQKRLEANCGIVDQMLDSKCKENGPIKVLEGREIVLA